MHGEAVQCVRHVLGAALDPRVNVAQVRARAVVELVELDNRDWRLCMNVAQVCTRAVVELQIPICS